MVWFPLSSIYLFISSFFLVFSFCSFWVTAGYQTEIVKEPLNPKQHTYESFRGISSKITKSGRIFEYF